MSEHFTATEQWKSGGCSCRISDHQANHGDGFAMRHPGGEPAMAYYSHRVRIECLHDGCLWCSGWDNADPNRMWAAHKALDHPDLYPDLAARADAMTEPVRMPPLETSSDWYRAPQQEDQ
jgi:hypothetical protein